MDNTLTKKIWFLWLQGLDNAPLVVRECYASWVRHNPDWEINFLHEGNIAEYTEFSMPNVIRQTFADLLRLKLLTEYGGVWIDATCFCVKPLNDWLPQHMTSGFFAFANPVPDRMMGNWFMAADKYNYILNTFYLKAVAYWHDNPDMTFIENSKWRFLQGLLNKMNKRIWFGSFVTKTLKVYNYFWPHFMFEQLYLNDANFKTMWDETPAIEADIPHTVFFAHMFGPLNDKIKAHIDNKEAPLYKLSWKFKQPDDLSGTIAGYLFDH